jgi:hypothetical protein
MAKCITRSKRCVKQFSRFDSEWNEQEHFMGTLSQGHDGRGFLKGLRTGEQIMKWQQLVMGEFLRIEQELVRVLNELTVDEINRQPAPDCNSIGWLAWHLTRSHDRNMSELMGEEQLWIADLWHARFNRAPDPGETGVGHTTEQAEAFRLPDSEVLMDYHHAILKRIEQYIVNRLTEEELDRETLSPTLKNVATVSTRITGVIQQGFLHVGQAGYVRGLLKGKGGYP